MPIKTSGFLRPPKEDVSSTAKLTPQKDQALSVIPVPEWYATVNPRADQFRGESISFARIGFLYETLQKNPSDQAAADLRKQLQRISLSDYHGEEKAVIRKSRLLTDGSLTAICSAHISWDIRAFAQWLRDRWWAGDTCPDLLRGVKKNRSTTQSGKAHITWLIDKDYPFKVSSQYKGQGALHIGQWWPLLICAHRDGAHGEIDSGIHGIKPMGALSVVLSGGGYANVDEGDTIQYCGTTSNNPPAPSACTMLMLTAYKERTPLRVLRSSSGSSTEYKPKKGVRYDGLYTIRSYEIIDRASVLHRFQLERVPDQEPICNEGPIMRPCLAELEALERDRKAGKTG